MESSKPDKSSSDPLNAVSLKVKNYKCFGDAPQGFEVIKPINVLIGRNNSGKSSLLDLIEHATSPKKFEQSSKYKGKDSALILTKPLTEDEIKLVFRENARNDTIGSFWDFGKKFIEKKITIEIASNGKKLFLGLESASDLDLRKAKKLIEELGTRIDSPFASFRFKKIRAERNIQPESSNPALNIQEDGRGATNIIERFINKNGLPRELVEDKLLDELNMIMAPDSKFKRIIVEQLEDNLWEIFLEEEQKGLIALSKSGSGLKTILLVLIHILLIPYIDKISLSSYIFGFEELENNLHPALQRRLFLYLRRKALTEKAYFFLTTHSNVVIDLFSGDNIAQIYHILHNGVEASSNPVTTYIERAGILDDLEIRASDLLQSNGIIWVEGPTDRIYINKWIELWSDGNLREGAHYQCIFYGGRLLAHLSVELPGDEDSSLIKVLSTNRNAIVLIDSDKRSESDQINETKKRICREIEEVHGFCWLTLGKEVENYIPKTAICKLYETDTARDLGLYETFWDYLDDIAPGEGKRYSDKKVVFAEKVRPYLEKQSLSATFDMEIKMAEIISRIKKWNDID
jgi:putative ATP-dependent endonuclease of the OLD family